LDRRWEQVEELLEDRLARDDRAAEVALHEVAEEEQVLLPERLVEAELLLQLGVALRRQAALADEQLDRVTRDQPDQRERDDGHPEKGRDQDAEPRDQKAQHRSAAPQCAPRNRATRAIADSNLDHRPGRSSTGIHVARAAIHPN